MPVPTVVDAVTFALGQDLTLPAIVALLIRQEVHAKAAIKARLDVSSQVDAKPDDSKVALSPKA